MTSPRFLVTQLGLETNPEPFRETECTTSLVTE